MYACVYTTCTMGLNCMCHKCRLGTCASIHVLADLFHAGCIILVQHPGSQEVAASVVMGSPRLVL